MSIEEAIEYNKNLEMYMKISDEQEPCKFLEENYIALSMAIEIMRKYQKIEQILHNGFGKGVYAVFDEIVKVVEDGNVD